MLLATELFNLMTFVPDSGCYQYQSIALLGGGGGGSEVFSEHKPIIHHYMTLLIIAPSELVPRFVLHAKHIASSARGCCSHSNRSMHPSISLLLLIISFLPLSQSVTGFCSVFHQQRNTSTFLVFVIRNARPSLLHLFCLFVSLTLSTLLTSLMKLRMSQDLTQGSDLFLYKNKIQKQPFPPPPPKKNKTKKTNNPAANHRLHLLHFCGKN